jgi:transcriptional regulator with XRE-family HTH domain
LFDPDALRAARLNAGMAQSRLARRVDAPGGDLVSKWERGLQSPRPATIRALAAALEVSIDQLLKPGPTNLRRLRILVGLSSAELAARVHVSQPTVQRWEEGRWDLMPDQRTLGELSGVLKVSVSEVQAALTECRRRRAPHA